MEISDPRELNKENLWHNLSAEEAIERLNTHTMLGLSSQEAAERLALFGANELKETPRPTFWARLLNQFKDFLVLILIFASLISFLLGDFTEAGAILAIVILNAALGVIQESRAEEALAALQKMTAPEAVVVRDGHQQTVESRLLVPGDLILLETGNYVPADARLIEAINLRIDEASLTGESLPVQKHAETVLDRELPLGDRRNSAYMGTLVTYGRGRAVVVSTGMHTQFGLIAQMVQSFESEPTPLQRKLEQLGKTLGIAALSICGLVFLVGVARYLISPTPGVTLLQEVLEMFLVAVSLAIAAVPEGLPAVVTICLALGMNRMVQRHALLRQLSAVEALGSATVICSDKTGTLTQNAMTVVKLYTGGQVVDVSGEGYQPEGEFSLDGRAIEPGELPELDWLLKTILLSNDACLETSGTEPAHLTYRMVGDPTEGALVVAAAKAGYWREGLEQSLPRVAEIPFDSERKRMLTVHAVTAGSGAGQNGRGEDPRLPADLPIGPPAPYLVCVKGAPDIILSLCSRQLVGGQVLPLGESERRRILEANAGLSDQALRVLGAAVKPLESLPVQEVEIGLAAQQLEHELVFLGMAGMIDPPRPEVKPAVEKARRAGIRSVMITGDYPNTAVAIARQIGLLRPQGQVLSGQEIDALDDPAFAARVEDVDVYARVSPQHKVRIVEALQARREVVSMTGDGVNDAPALKKADIGVAMGITGTDVSKEAAVMVLTDDNYSSIVAAIEEGRIIYANIRKFVFYLLSANVGEILIILVATLLGWPLPLTAIHLLVLNLITDGAPALALGMEKGAPDIMERPPRPPAEPVINRVLTWRIVVQGIVDTFAVLGAFRLALHYYPDNVQHAQTIAFATLSISELLRAYSARSETYFLYKIGLFTNRWMQYAVFSSLVILLAIIYVPALDPVFKTTFLGWRDWLLIAPLMLVPVIAAELTKVFQRR